MSSDVQIKSIEIISKTHNTLTCQFFGAFKVVSDDLFLSKMHHLCVFEAIHLFKRIQIVFKCHVNEIYYFSEMF